MLRVDTIGKVNPIGKPRIYFAARKEDYAYLNSVISNLFMAENVAVYYDDGQDTRNTDNETLLTMSMIVLILTEDLLKAPTDVMTRVFPLAIKNGIPLMILGMSDNVGYLLDDFCQKNNLGNRHVIFPNKKDSDRTFLTKLKDFMKEHAFSETDHEKIERSLDGRIFLSYRKVDKPLASKVIARLNGAKECLTYGLWYDEYLTAGENFDDEIQQYIDASDVFLLLLTEAMLQKGSYALERELFHAVESEKNVVIVDVIERPHDLPEDFAAARPIVVPANAIAALPGILAELIGKRARTTKWEKVDQLYRLGLAYLRGIAKNKDEKLGTTLIREAASAGHMEACDSMVKICVEHANIEAAIGWQKELVNYHGNRFGQEHTLTALDGYLHQLGILAEYHAMMEDVSNMRQLYQLVYNLLEQTNGWEDDPRILEHAVIVNDKMGTFAEIDLAHAENKIGQLQLIESFYQRSFEYAQKYALFEHSLKAGRYLYTPLMRLTGLEAKWTKIPLEEIFGKYQNILRMMLETDREYSCYETLCDLSGCYQAMTQLAEQVCPENVKALALKWLEYARQAFLTSRHLERCGKYAYAMEYVAKLQYSTGEVTEAIRNLVKATKARDNCITDKERSGISTDVDAGAMFFDYVNLAKMNLGLRKINDAAVCIKNAEVTMLNYPKLLQTQRNVIMLENLKNTLAKL